MDIERADIYQKITSQIVEAIEQGAGRYKMPWHTTADCPFSPINAVTKRPYRGINVLALWAAAQKHGYTCGAWGTYQQWKQLGAQVRRAEKAASIVFWKFSEIEREEQEDGEDGGTPRRIPLAREYFVFNASQVEGYTAAPASVSLVDERLETAETFFSAAGAEVLHGGNEAFYCAETDQIRLPRFEQFDSATAYYSVRSHETIHWTAPSHRLGRDLTARFGSEAYAAEELVAELGAAFLCAILGVTNKPRYGFSNVRRKLG